MRRRMVRIRIHGNDGGNDNVKEEKEMAKEINLTAHVSDEDFYENRITELTIENREKTDLIRRQQKEIEAMAEEIVTLKEKIVKLVNAYV